MLPPAAHNVQTTDPARAAETVLEDVACSACGYDVRGLPVDGRCPECGAGVYPSFLAHRERTAPLPTPDRRWATHIAEGAALSLVSLGLLVVLCVAPEGALHLPYRDVPVSETPGRVLLLGVACAAWVTGWYSVWKLTVQAPKGERLVPRWRARVTRWVTTAYFLLPVLVAAAPEYNKNPPPGPLIFLVLLAPLAGGVLFCLMAGLFRRVGGGWARLEAVLLALLVPVAVLFSAGMTSFMISRHSRRVGSIDLLFDLPLSPYVPPELGRAMTGVVSRSSEADLYIAGIAGVAVWAAVLHLRLMLRYLPYAGREQ